MDEQLRRLKALRDAADLLISNSCTVKMNSQCFDELAYHSSSSLPEHGSLVFPLSYSTHTGSANIVRGMNPQPTTMSVLSPQPARRPPDYTSFLAPAAEKNSVDVSDGAPPAAAPSLIRLRVMDQLQRLRQLSREGSRLIASVSL